MRGSGCTSARTGGSSRPKTSSPGSRAVLEAEPEVVQVGINFADAVTLTGNCAPEQTVHRAPDTGRYVLTEKVALGPAMFDTARLDRAGGVDSIAETRMPRDRQPRRGALRPAGMRTDHAIAGYDLAVSDPSTRCADRPAICLSMIVRNEAHIVTEVTRRGRAPHQLVGDRRHRLRRQHPAD